jgi:hypothetical protein
MVNLKFGGVDDTSVKRQRLKYLDKDRSTGKPCRKIEETLMSPEESLGNEGLPVNSFFGLWD